MEMELGRARTSQVAGEVVGNLVRGDLALTGQAPSLHGLVLQLAALEGHQVPVLIHAPQLIRTPRPCIASLCVPVIMPNNLSAKVPVKVSPKIG